MENRPGTPSDNAPASRSLPLLTLALVALVAFVYARVGGFGFVNFEDDAIVSENPRVLAGLTAASVRWAFTTFETGHWQPVAWMSHMFDISAFGPLPGWHHCVNGALHTVNTLLLFLLLFRATKAAGTSWLVAALFAVHPLNVESVAWISQRKELLAAQFWLLSSLAHVRWAESPTLARRLAAVAFFALGLMSATTVFTLPFALLLIDRWPLRRTAPMRELVAEKWPLFLLATVGAAAGLLAQHVGTGMPHADFFPLGVRFSNASVAWATYLGKAAWPTSLSVFYPHPWVTGQAWPAWRIAGSAALLLGISAVALRTLGSRPWLAFGWAWFLGTSMPTIGLVQLGMSAMADHAVYIPMIGLFVAAAWEAAELSRLVLRDPRARAVLAAGLVLALAIPARVQASQWESSETLFQHALAVDPDNWLAHANLGRSRMHAGDLPYASAHFAEAIRLRPRFVEAWFNFGMAHYKMGDLAGALRAFREGLSIAPHNARAIEMSRRIEREIMEKHRAAQPPVATPR
jgi:hypothetical protein